MHVHDLHQHVSQFSCIHCEGIIGLTDLFFLMCSMSLSYFYVMLQIAPYDQLQMIERLVDVPKPTRTQA